MISKLFLLLLLEPIGFSTSPLEKYYTKKAIEPQGGLEWPQLMSSGGAPLKTTRQQARSHSVIAFGKAKLNSNLPMERTQMICGHCESRRCFVGLLGQPDPSSIVCVTTEWLRCPWNRREGSRFQPGRFTNKTSERGYGEQAYFFGRKRQLLQKYHIQSSAGNIVPGPWIGRCWETLILRWRNAPSNIRVISLRFSSSTIEVNLIYSPFYAILSKSLGG